jgi:hypothetical protein
LTIVAGGVAATQANSAARTLASGLKPRKTEKWETRSPSPTTERKEKGQPHVDWPLSFSQRNYVSNTTVTAAGVEEFQEALPKCQITR